MINPTTTVILSPTRLPRRVRHVPVQRPQATVATTDETTAGDGGDSTETQPTDQGVHAPSLGDAQQVPTDPGPSDAPTEARPQEETTPRDTVVSQSIGPGYSPSRDQDPQYPQQPPLMQSMTTEQIAPLMQTFGTEAVAVAKRVVDHMDLVLESYVGDMLIASARQFEYSRGRTVIPPEIKAKMNPQGQLINKTSEDMMAWTESYNDMINQQRAMHNFGLTMLSRQRTRGKLGRSLTEPTSSSTNPPSKRKAASDSDEDEDSSDEGPYLKAVRYENAPSRRRPNSQRPENVQQLPTI
ncbi:hypothetical protein BG011_002627 [Mortierella polycephala]|uniref:Uncharacterized protein n=1 Tax=Mortierella polycephala TaxID=41804 RepID=A0A9P6TT94_9FUNG|nr:hypothetical protein BG011_002627 [Mortierella polycephala]